jgi:hypothetical protein
VAAGTGKEATGEVAGTAVVGSGATAFGCLSRFSAVRRRSVLEPIMRIRRNAGGCRTRTTGRGKFAKDIEANRRTSSGKKYCAVSALLFTLASPAFAQPEEHEHGEHHAHRHAQGHRT